MFSFLSQTFMLYALLLGLFLAIAAAALSPFLVLSKQALIADGMAHISFTGIIIGLLLSNEPLYFAVPFAIAASIFITFLTTRGKLENDAAIGVVSVFSLALGLIIISVGNGFNRSIESLLVGSILTVTQVEVILSALIAVLVLLFITIFYRKLLTTTYDDTYAQFSGIKVNILKYILAALTAVFVVVGVKTIGALLISAFIIFPALIAKQIARSFNFTVIGSLIAAFIAVWLGVLASYHLDLPTGPSIIMVFSLLLGLSYLLKTFVHKRG